MLFAISDLQMHEPVLLKEAIEFLNLHAGSFIVDGTIAGGGHAQEILKAIGPRGRLLGIDWDENILSGCKDKLGQHNNLILVKGNYADLAEILKTKKLGKADGLLLDLGFSSEQLEHSGRGFSFAKNEPLLMTYDSNRKSVKTILEELGEKELAKVIFEFSGEKFAMRIAKSVKEKEKIKPIETTLELREVIRSAVPRNYEHGRIDPATRTFQALRIYANDELGNLQKIMASLPGILKQKGRAAVISFHSLEDKIVKNSFRDLERRGILKILTKKPIVPSKEEITSNPRSRSAKLRAAEIIR